VEFAFKLSTSEIAMQTGSFTVVLLPSQNDVAKELSWEKMLVNSILAGVYSLERKRMPLNVCSSVICAS
jgi:hypothetical protein